MNGTSSDNSAAESKGTRLSRVSEVINALRNNINTYFVGKEDVTENLLVCLFAGGHLLIEDVPGLGKTTLASTLSKSVSMSFGRLQCTPDTLPGDVTGVSVFNPKTTEFTYSKGVVMNQLLLADEINRATPKTQSALLEAMSENQVTVDGEIHALPSPFMVIATQNPIEYVGTYPLPEAQLDRFMMRLSVGYPGKSEEIRIAKNLLSGITAGNITSVCTPEDILEIKEVTENIKVADSVLEYIVDIIRKTREEENLSAGASPRAMLALLRASQAKALLSGRDYVRPDDVKSIASKVLLHRLILTPEAKSRQADVTVIFRDLMTNIKVPIV